MIRDRYHIAEPSHGLLATDPTFAAAVATATGYAQHEPGEVAYRVTIFDSMARRGRPQAWTVASDGKPVVTATRPTLPRLCPVCRGSSYVGEDDCPNCGGTGTV